MGRQGRDIKIDIKIGFLHCYPSGELYFENKNEEITTDQLAKRNKQREDSSNLTDNQLDKISTLFSSGARTQNLKSCYMSVKTPQTHATKSINRLGGIHNRTVDEKVEKFSCFSKGRYGGGPMSQADAKSQMSRHKSTAQSRA